MTKCTRCNSKELSSDFEIKFGLHDWHLCNECSNGFYEWVIDKKSDNGCEWGKDYFRRKYGEG